MCVDASGQSICSDREPALGRDHQHASKTARGTAIDIRPVGRLVVRESRALRCVESVLNSVGRMVRPRGERVRVTEHLNLNLSVTIYESRHERPAHWRAIRPLIG